jgi:hypothetical protein
MRSLALGRKSRTCLDRDLPRALVHPRGIMADDREPQPYSALSTDRRRHHARPRPSNAGPGDRLDAASVAARIAGVFAGIATSLNALVMSLLLPLAVR